MDLTIYWFMFPVSMLIATTAMFSGIGGAAFFIPIFALAFPLLGPEYPLQSLVAAIGVALLTETFGFSSGFVGYYRRGLIDFRSALRFFMVSIPIAIVGAFVALEIANDDWLKGAYGVLMLILAVVMIRHMEHGEAPVEEGEPSDRAARDAVEAQSVGAAAAIVTRTIRSNDGRVYTFAAPRHGKGAFATAIGAFLTGMVGVGIGEVVMPQLAKRNRVPLPVAAATSVLIVIVTVAAASFTLISTLINEGGMDAVPWNLVMYTVPAVIIGGQIGPRLQAYVFRHALFTQLQLERAIGVLFAIIGMAMVWLVIK